MYKAEEGRADLRRKEMLSAAIMLISTAVLSLFVWATVSKYGVSVPYVGVYVLWFALSVYFTKAYLFLTPRCRFGAVTDIKNFKVVYIRSHGGAAGTGATYSGAEAVECTLTIAFDSGKVSDLVFVYKGDLKTLKVGDRVGIFRFLRMPVWETDPNQ
ncbi:MAG: hypothetical protein IKK83_02825 [Clostridia bacterium]|nr:hypothetical protein [Clostridia bacterium]